MTTQNYNNVRLSRHDKGDTFNKNSGFLKTGSWKYASRVVKAHNNQLFADVYALWDYLNNTGYRDATARGYFYDRTGKVQDIIVAFAKWKLHDTLAVADDNNDIDVHDLDSDLVASAYKGDIDSLILLYQQLIKKYPAPPYSQQHVYNHRDPWWIASSGYDLLKRVKKLIDTPISDINAKFLALDGVKNWVHTTGSLFGGSTADNAPITKDFCDLLSAKSTTLFDILKYTSSDIKDWIQKHYGDDSSSDFKRFCGGQKKDTSALRKIAVGVLKKEHNNDNSKL